MGEQGHVNTNPTPADDTETLRALTVLCHALAVDLAEMHAAGAIDLEQWPNAKTLVEAALVAGA